LKGPLQPVPALAVLRLGPPEQPQRPGQTQPLGPLITWGSLPLQGRPKVVLLGGQASLPGLLPRPPEVGRFGQGQAPVPMAGPQRLDLSSLAQLVPGDLADRLQHPIAALRRLVDQQRLVHQRCDQQQDIQIVVVGADLLGGLQRATAGEHRQPPNQDLLGP
jgi:hypothetical protein